MIEIGQNIYPGEKKLKRRILFKIFKDRLITLIQTIKNMILRF